MLEVEESLFSFSEKPSFPLPAESLSELGEDGIDNCLLDSGDCTSDLILVILNSVGLVLTGLLSGILEDGRICCSCCITGTI